MKRSFLVVAMAATFALTGCMETLNGLGNKQTIGAGTGAVLGGVVGSKFGKGTGQLVGVGLGAVLGGMIGNEIGRSLDKADQMYANRAMDQAATAPVNRTISWNNPESGNYGYVTPVRDGRSNDGRYCREYQQTIYIDGRAQTANGTACQNKDGTWDLAN